MYRTCKRVDRPVYGERVRLHGHVPRRADCVRHVGSLAIRFEATTPFGERSRCARMADGGVARRSSFPLGTRLPLWGRTSWRAAVLQAPGFAHQLPGAKQRSAAIPAGAKPGTSGLEKPGPRDLCKRQNGSAQLGRKAPGQSRAKPLNLICCWLAGLGRAATPLNSQFACWCASRLH